MYIIQEFQTTNGTTVLTPPFVYSNFQEAESTYHLTLGAAAISNVELHVVGMYDEYGNVIKNEWYEHRPEEV